MAASLTGTNISEREGSIQRLRVVTKQDIIKYVSFNYLKMCFTNIV